MSVTALRPAAICSDIKVAVPGDADVPALIELINTLAAERNQLFIQPVDPISGQVLLNFSSQHACVKRIQIQWLR